MSRVLEFSVSYNFRALGKFLQIHIKVLCGRIFHSQWCETIIVFWGSLTKVTPNHASISKAHQLLSHINISVIFWGCLVGSGAGPTQPDHSLANTVWNHLPAHYTIWTSGSFVFYFISHKKLLSTYLKDYKGGRSYSIFLTIPIILIYIFNMIDTSVTKTCFTELTGFR